MLQTVIFLALLPMALGTIGAIVFMLFQVVVILFYGIGWLIGLPFLLIEKAWRLIKGALA